MRVYFYIIERNGLKSVLEDLLRIFFECIGNKTVIIIHGNYSFINPFAVNIVKMTIEFRFYS